MENNHHSNGFMKFLREKGYYIVVGICVVAIGVSGFYLVKSATKTESAGAEKTVSVPVTIETEKKAGATEETKANETEATGETAKNPTGQSEAAAETEASKTPVTIRTVCAPVSGDTLYDYSMEALSYNETMRDWRTHDGMDIAAEEGTAVGASEAGVVTAVSKDDYLGNTVVISHDSGYETTYANLSDETKVTVGQKVSAGETIGLIGTSSLLEVSEAPHLHFSVSCNGAAVDPKEYLAG